MAGPASSSTADAGTRFPSIHIDNRRGQLSSSARISPRPAVLTVKTPLLPRRSGITMESARSYGASMEKRDLASLADRPETRRPSRSPLKWVAALALCLVFGIGIMNNVLPRRESGSVLVDNLRSNIYENSLQNRQSSSSNSSANQTDPLAPYAYRPLPLGSIKPLGWLKDQLQLMADGLAGNEMNFYPIVQDSTWLGGATDYSPLNEGLPYWFNGLVPLAYGLGDSGLITQVQNALSTVLQRQNTTDGWIGPPHSDGTKTSQDLWGRFPFMLGMIQMAEADEALAPEIVGALYRFLPTFYKTLGDGLYPQEVWGRARYADAIITWQWLYENYPMINGTDQRPLLMNTMTLLKSHGADWVGYFQPDTFFFQDIDDIAPAVTDQDFYFQYLHGVNAGQGLKTPAVDYRFTHNQSLLEVQRNAIDWTLQYHGNSAGSVVGDERENGQAPNRGSELCTAVETMYSMSYAYGVTGENSFADNAERIAFNALPAMMTADNWAHQYISQANQPWASPVDGGAVFWNVGDFGTTFGTAPNYPCCAVNHPQGYPKFLSHTFMSVGDDGLAHVLLSPANVTAKLNNGAYVNIAAVTDYPFSDVLTYTINSDNPFTFYIRIPGWAASPSLTQNGNSVQLSQSQGGLTPIPVGAGTTTVQYVLQSSLRYENRANDTLAIYHGALLYALDVGYAATTSSGTSDVTRNKPPTNDPAIQVALMYNANENENSANTPSQARDYNISNTMEWAYAIDPTTLQWFASNSSGSSGQAVNVSATNDYSAALANPIWDYQAPPQYATAQACVITWDLLGNMPFRPPLANNRTCKGNPVQVALRPYGSLKVHMAELPTKSLPGNSSASSGSSAS